ncbi:MAG: hypothetical protein ACXABY_14610, partial [Candidatus Thorarchaeota archaeon]
MQEELQLLLEWSKENPLYAGIAVIVSLAVLPRLAGAILGQVTIGIFSLVRGILRSFFGALFSFRITGHPTPMRKASAVMRNMERADLGLGPAREHSLACKFQSGQLWKTPGGKRIAILRVRKFPLSTFGPKV